MESAKETVKKALAYLVETESQSLKSFLCDDASVKGLCNIAKELISAPAPVIDELYIIISRNDPVVICGGKDKIILSTVESPPDYATDSAIAKIFDSWRGAETAICDIIKWENVISQRDDDRFIEKRIIYKLK